MRSTRLWFLLVLVLVGLLAVLPLPTTSAPLPGYRLEATWPAAAHGLSAPNNLSVGTDGRVWLLDGPAQAVVALNPDSTLSERRVVPKDSLDLAAEPGGDIYVGRWSAAPLQSTVGRYNAAGTAVWTRSCNCATGTGVAATAGRTWFTDPKNRTLMWFGRSDGRVSGQITPRGAQAGFPADVAVSPDGTVFATDLNGDAVYAWPDPYLPTDFKVWTMLEGSGPFRIGVGAQDDGELVVAVLFSEGLIRVHRPDGAPVARFWVPGEPMDLAVGPGGKIYVLDEDSREVRVYAPGTPPTPTPVPPDPPITEHSCKVVGTRSLAPARIDRCGSTEVTLNIQAVCPGGAVVGADVVLIIDESQSMRNGKLEGARDAAGRFLNGLDFRYHQAALVTFSDTAAVSQALTTDRPKLDAAMAALKVDGSATNIYAAIRSASEHLATAGRPNALPVIVLLTDGEPTRPMVPEPNTAALVAAERARARRTYLVTIGLGNTIDSLLLEAIASSRQDFYYAPSVVDLDRIYRTILKVVASMNLTDLIIEDTPIDPFTRYLPGSGAPPPLLVNDTLTWTRPALPLDGISMTYRLAGTQPGRGPAARARVRYLDADGTRRSFVFPEPNLEVVLPVPSPSANTATPAPTDDPTVPTVPPPLPATPPPAVCGTEDLWRLAITVYPDTVGAGPYACPGCNGTWDGGDYWRTAGGTLPPATVIVSDGGGTPLWIGEVAATSARAPAYRLVPLCAPPPYQVTLARIPVGFVSCPNSPAVRWVRATAGSFGQRAEVSFGLWNACRQIVPTPLPPVATATVLPACP